MSVLDQGIGDTELIVVDGFSADGSRKQIEKISKEDSRLKPFRRDQDHPALGIQAESLHESITINMRPV